jgi:hypothetical protein
MSKHLIGTTLRPEPQSLRTSGLHLLTFFLENMQDSYTTPFLAPEQEEDDLASGVGGPDCILKAGFSLPAQSTRSQPRPQPTDRTPPFDRIPTFTQVLGRRFNHVASISTRPPFEQSLQPTVTTFGRLRGRGRRAAPRSTLPSNSD